MGGLAILSLVFGLLQIGQPPSLLQPEPGSYVYQAAYSLDESLRGTPKACDLQPGDICFAVNRHIVSRIGHRLSGAGLPNHSMIAFALPDRRMAILEAGPHSKLILEAKLATEHLKSYEDNGSKVWVRRRQTPLTEEQSAALTQFCLAQHNKPFPALRLIGQLTPFRSRGPIRTEFMGKVDPNQRTYFCSELVLNSLAVAGVLDPEPLRPSATYPSDLFFNESSNPHVDRGVKQLASGWHPPARWVSSPP